jgi:hypothetical protein
MKFKVKDHFHSVNKNLFIDVMTGDRVQFKEKFNAGDLMRIMHDWLVENGYGSASDKDFGEIFYHHKFMQGGLEEVRWWWRFKKKPDEDNGANFFLYHVFVQARIIAMTKDQVIKNDMKFKTNMGDIEIEVSGRLEVDVGRKWRDHWLLKNFFEMYIERMINQRIQFHKDEIRSQVGRFKSMLKGYFQLPLTHGSVRQDEGNWDTNTDFV